MNFGMILAFCSIAFAVEPSALPATETPTNRIPNYASENAEHNDVILVPFASSGEIRRFDVKNGVVLASEPASEPVGDFVYANSGDPVGLPLVEYGPVADDLTSICGSFDLTLLNMLVGGQGNGSGPGFDIEIELYDGCPSEGGSPIAGTHYIANLPDDSGWYVSLNLNESPVPLLGTVWLEVRSTSSHAVWAFGGGPEIGTSEDRVDTPLILCNTNFGGCGGICANGNVEIRGINCEPAPTGACCTTLSNGEYTCAENTMQTHCNGRFLENASCESDPFDPPCGTASCCTFDESCTNLTRSECGIGDVYWAWPRTCEDQGYFCPPLACITATNSCDETNVTRGGCNVIHCCEAICAQNPSCCETAWDESCVELYRQQCVLDRCFDAAPITCNDSLILDNTHATIGSTDPSFGCTIANPGPRGSVWAKFVPTETSARISTCYSPAPADNSIVAMYSGWCESLFLVGCSDNVPGCQTETGQNSVFCTHDLIPGETYYIQLASWTDADRGPYNLEVQCPAPAVCAPPAPPVNDQCANATPIGGGTHPYTTTNSTTDGPPLPTPVCNEGFGHDFGHDVWFNYTAPGHGFATIDLCLETDFDSGIAVYEGCQCPAQTTDFILCNDDSCPPEDPEIAGASRVTFETNAGQCYKIRVGGFGSGTVGSGKITVGFTFIDVFCPDGNVMFINPPNGTVDARQPSAPNSVVPLYGIQNITVAAPPNGDISCWQLCETATFGLPNSIAGLTDNGDGTYRIDLSRPVTPGATTRISYNPISGPAISATYYFHPANVNGDGFATSIDILRLIDCLNSVQPSTSCPHGVYSRDIDRSGVFSPPDILRVIDLLNGADLFTVWNATPLPGTTCTP